MTIHRDDLRALIHLLALAPLYLSFVTLPWLAWALPVLGVAALIAPRLPWLQALSRTKGLDAGIISFPLAIALALFLSIAFAPPLGLGEGQALLLARAACLPLWLADPIQGVMGRRAPPSPSRKSPVGLKVTVPLLMGVTMWWAFSSVGGTNLGAAIFGLGFAAGMVALLGQPSWRTQDRLLLSLGLVAWAFGVPAIAGLGPIGAYGAILSLPLLLAAWVETWWRWGPDNPVLVLLCWLGYAGLLSLLP